MGELALLKVIKRRVASQDWFLILVNAASFGNGRHLGILFNVFLKCI